MNEIENDKIQFTRMWKCYEKWVKNTDIMQLPLEMLLWDAFFTGYESAECKNIELENTEEKNPKLQLKKKKNNIIQMKTEK